MDSEKTERLFRRPWDEKKRIKRCACKACISCLPNLLDSSLSDSDHDLQPSRRMHLDFTKLDSSWSTVSNNILPDISENYFLYQTNPTSGKCARFQRHLKKARKFCAENFFRDIAYHNISEVYYVKARCKQSMQNIVHVSNTGQTGSLYSLNVCILWL